MERLLNAYQEGPCRSNSSVSVCLCCASAKRHSLLSCRRSLIRARIVPRSCAWQKLSRHFSPACAVLQRAFLKRLPHKFRTSPTHMGAMPFVAGLLYGCNSAIALQFVCAGKPVALRAQRADQARRERLPHTGKRMHKREARMRFGQLLNALVIFPNGLTQDLNLPHHRLHEQNGACDHGRILCGRNGIPNGRPELLDLRRRTPAVAFQKRFQRAPPRFAERSQVRPVLEESEGESGAALLPGAHDRREYSA
jgi:hypothetical protein